MKKYIKANRAVANRDEMLSRLAICAQALADAINAKTEAELRSAASNLPKYYRDLDREQIIDKLVYYVNYLHEQYENERKIADAYPKVKQDLIDFLKDLGYAMTPITGKHDWGQEAFVIIPADKWEFKDLNIVCKQISDEFGNRWDTPLSGSWTGHSSQIDGVDFHVSFERDYDYDPSGKKMSLQLYF